MALSSHLWSVGSTSKVAATTYVFHRWIFHLPKTDCQFLLMGLHQTHEQNNAIMKSMGGATSPMNKVYESSLAR